MSDPENDEFDGPLITGWPLYSPGRWENWTGLERWRTRHGPATVCWDRHQIARADHARLDDGSRMIIDGPRVGSLTSRIPRKNGDGFIHGLLVVYEEDVEFVPLVRNYRFPARAEVLPALQALRSTPEFMDFLRTDPVHAYAAYTALQNRNVTLPDGTLISFGQRSAAGLIAALRDNGEDYLDYFMDEQHYEACLEFLPELRGIFERHGFKVTEH